MQAPSFSSFPSFDEPGSSALSTLGSEEKKQKRKRRDRSRSPRRETRRAEHREDHRDSHRRSRSKEREFKLVDKDSRRDRRNKSREREGSRKTRRYGSQSRSPRRLEDTDERRRHHKRDEPHNTNSSNSVSEVHYDTSSTVLDARPLFFSDRRGDPLNIQYGGPHAGDIPKYKLVAGGRQVLGLSPALTVLYRSNKGIEIGRGSRRRIPTLTDSSSRKLLAAPPTRRLLASAEAEYKYIEVDGFLRIPYTIHRGERAPEESYRAILTSRDEDSDSASDMGENMSTGSAPPEWESDDEENRAVLTAHQQTLKDLEQRLSTDPTSLPTWLSLLTHTLSTIPLSSKNALRARAEVALSVLERARKAHSTNKHSTPFVLRWMRAGEEVWSSSKLRAEWEEALGSEDPEIVMEWLDWRVRSCNNGIEGLIEDGAKAIKLMKEDEMGMLRALWRIAVALEQAGFTERASSLFQAQAELTFEVPQALYGLPLDALLEALEEFWDAEVPRVGEKGAQGWATWMPSQSTVNIPSQLPKLSPVAPGPNDDPYVYWATREATRDCSSIIPSRTTDEDEDPYATVLFADVKPMLFILKSQRAKHAFRLIWLAFLGLRVPGLDSLLRAGAHSNTDIPFASVSNDAKWNATCFTHQGYLDVLFPSPVEITRRLVSADAYAGVLVGREREFSARAFEGPVKNWSFEVFGALETLSPGQAWMWRAEDARSARDVEFIRRIFEQCRLPNGDEKWDVLALAFEAAINVKGALKLSKTFLSSARDSLVYWAAHAQLEQLRGRPKDATKVYETVLGASDMSTRSADTATLWYDWAEMYWLAGESDLALGVVMRSAGVEGTGSGINILRARRSLDERCSVTGVGYVSWVKLRALLELLAAGDVEGMLSVFDAHTEKVKGEHEVLVVACLLMLFRHAHTLRAPTPQAILRERVQRALEKYPDNTAVLGLFLEAERGQGVWGRVRAALGDGSSIEKSVYRRIFEVWVGRWEKGRWEAEKERIRNGLAFAVSEDRLRGSPVLWRIYIEVEIRANALDRAKALLYRAIGQCPMCKELYLLAFMPLRSVFTTNELDALADTMAERGLRTRTGLDEVMEGWNGRRIPDASDESEEDLYGEGDIEQNAETLRRLRPY